MPWTSDPAGMSHLWQTQNAILSPTVCLNPKTCIPIVPVFKYSQLCRILQFLFVLTESYCILQVQYKNFLYRKGYVGINSIINCWRNMDSLKSILNWIFSGKISYPVLHQEVRHRISPEFCNLHAIPLLINNWWHHRGDEECIKGMAKGCIGHAEFCFEGRQKSWVVSFPSHSSTLIINLSSPSPITVPYIYIMYLCYFSIMKKSQENEN